MSVISTQWEGTGLNIEHILLSVTVAHGKGSCGQVDDSSAAILERELMKYHGVKSVQAEVLYQHTKIEPHVAGCECYKCTQGMEVE